MSEVLLQKILEEISGIKGEVSGIKGEISEIKGEISEMKADIAAIKAKQDQMDHRQGQMDRKLDSVIVQTGGLMEFRTEFSQKQLALAAKLEDHDLDIKLVKRLVAGGD